MTGGVDGTNRGTPALRQILRRVDWRHARPSLQLDFIRLYSGVHSCVLEYRSVYGLFSAN